MARSYVPRLIDVDVVVEPLPRIEAIVAECHHVSRAAVDSDTGLPDSFTAATILINLSTDPRAHELVRPLRHAFSFARTRSRDFAPEDEASLVDWIIPQERSDFACVVIFADITSGLTAERLKHLIARIGKDIVAEATSVLVVCDESRHFDGLIGLYAVSCGT